MSDSVIREHLTIKDLNCGNCPKHSIKAHPIRSGNIQMCGDDCIDDMAPAVTRARGNAVVKDCYARIRRMGLNPDEIAESIKEES